MDLRSIINSDSGPEPPRKSAAVPPPHFESPARVAPGYATHTRGAGGGGGGGVGYQEHQAQRQHHEPRPPQPSPIQPPPHRGLQYPHGPPQYPPVQSPYQPSPASSLHNGQYPFPQTQAHQGPVSSPAGQVYQHATQERAQPMISPGPQHRGTPSSAVPTSNPATPGANASLQYRPQSSHSVATPSSVHGTPNPISRGSPHSSQGYAIPPPPPFHQQQFQNPQFQSQPATPLGPSQSVGRPSPGLQRDSTTPYYQTYTPLSARSSSSHGASARVMASPKSALASPVPYTPDHGHPDPNNYTTMQERERSASVSPKTIPPRHNSAHSQSSLSTLQYSEAGSHATPAKRKASEGLPDPRSILNPSGTANGISSIESSAPHKLQRRGSISSHGSGHIEIRQPSVHATPAHTASAVYNEMVNGRNQAVPDSAHVQQASVKAMSPQGTAADQQIEQPRKKQKIEQIPVYARRAGRAPPNNPLLPNKRGSSARPVPPRPESGESKIRLMPDPLPSGVHDKVLRDEANGHPAAVPSHVSVGAVFNTEPVLAKEESPLGPWEYSIINMLPSEELTKTIADFLFVEVVNRNDVAAASVHGKSAGGAVVEIEAKLGQIIDKHTNDRLRLPIMTECVVSKSDPNLRIAFKSSMTEGQHAAFNKFLNEAVTGSLQPKAAPGKPPPPPRTRIPVSYVHSRETDSFYELSQAAELTMPAAIRAQLSSRHNKAKVRITTDQKTGEIKAKIVKVRVADIDVYCPRQPFDWRVSVNLEMPFDGDMRELQEVMEGGRRAPERNKDRMTYKHLAYQIDLTQVTIAEAGLNNTGVRMEKEHELEIELDAAMVRRQGQLLQAGRRNGFEELVRGFVDNVRVLNRHMLKIGQL